jgi:hypothetical protein
MPAANLILKGSDVMRYIRAVGLAATAALALLSAMAGTASAGTTMFVASKTGNLITAKVKTQVFVFSAGTVECTAAKITSGEAIAGLAEDQKVKMQYEGCTAFGFVGVTFSEVEYFIGADELTKILKPFTITTTGCTVSVPEQMRLEYNGPWANREKAIEWVPQAKGIEYSASGALCAQTGTFANGTAKGTMEIVLAGATLEVK